MNIRFGRPSEPEERNDIERPSDASERKTAILFNTRPGSVPFLGPLEVSVPPKEDSKRYVGSNSD
jgi:hypothetical protein